MVVTLLEVLVPVPSLPSIEASLLLAPTASDVAAGEGLFGADGEFGGAGGGEAFAAGVFEGGEFERQVAGVLDDDLVFDGLAGFAGLGGGHVGAFALDPLELFDREVRFGGTLVVTLLEVLVPVPSLPSIEASLVVVPTASTWLQVKDSSSPTCSSVAPDGVMPSQVGVFQSGEFERHVAGVLDRDLVFDGLAEFAFQFAGAVVGFAFEPLLLFDREARFGGDFGGDFVGGLGAGAFVAFDGGFVGVGADRQHVGAGEGLFGADGQFGGAGGADALQPVSFRAANLSGRLPVFLTMILYSTVWPSLPVFSPRS